MTLVDDDEAIYLSVGGTRLVFRRSGGPKDLFLCS
jgi:hypothetical protein